MSQSNLRRKRKNISSFKNPKLILDFIVSTPKKKYLFFTLLHNHFPEIRKIFPKQFPFEKKTDEKTNSCVKAISLWTTFIFSYFFENRKIFPKQFPFEKKTYEKNKKVSEKIGFWTILDRRFWKGSILLNLHDLPHSPLTTAFSEKLPRFSLLGLHFHELLYT